MMDKLKLAACGVDCNGCGTRNKEHDIKAAEMLVKWYREQGWIGQDEGAEAVQKTGPSCTVCWAEEIENNFCSNCSIRACCVEKGIDHCGDCSVFPCDRYIKWIDNLDHHKKAMEYLLVLKANMLHI